ncbi:hypothetical protein D3C75_221770 [compost metagenome]
MVPFALEPFHHIAGAKAVMLLFHLQHQVVHFIQSTVHSLLDKMKFVRSFLPESRFIIESAYNLPERIIIFTQKDVGETAAAKQTGQNTD